MQAVSFRSIAYHLLGICLLLLATMALYKTKTSVIAPLNALLFPRVIEDFSGIIHALNGHMKRKKEILVVEDDLSSRKLVAVALRSDYDIAQAATGVEAIDQAHVRSPRPNNHGSRVTGDQRR